MHQDIAFLAVFTFVYSTLARGIEGTPFGGALLFVVCDPFTVIENADRLRLIFPSLTLMRILV